MLGVGVGQGDCGTAEAAFPVGAGEVEAQGSGTFG